MVYVQFTDEDQTEVCSVFTSKQDPEHYQNLGIVEADDDRLIEYWVSLPETLLRY